MMISVAMSVCFTYLPLLSALSGGWGIIVITVAASAVAALLFPLKTQEHQEEEE
ncbi:hypothetical protein [Clostridium sp. AM58-1XD]|uniref:hypothetical protein n=1 Tax=Clostridium sp. AM58-1XD TaxID=2292307 RepID=UPI00325A9264